MSQKQWIENARAERTEIRLSLGLSNRASTAQVVKMVKTLSTPKAVDAERQAVRADAIKRLYPILDALGLPRVYVGADGSVQKIAERVVRKLQDLKRQTEQRIKELETARDTDRELAAAEGRRATADRHRLQSVTQERDLLQEQVNELEGRVADRGKELLEAAYRHRTEKAALERHIKHLEGEMMSSEARASAAEQQVELLKEVLYDLQQTTLKAAMAEVAKPRGGAG